MLEVLFHCCTLQPATIPVLEALLQAFKCHCSTSFTSSAGWNLCLFKGAFLFGNSNLQGLCVESGIVTDNDTLCYIFSATSKCQASSPSPLRKQMFYVDHSKGKLMPQVFFHNQVIIYHRFLLEKYNVSRAMYKDILHCL
jgi:hypothetical protein